ncbi:MAG TPA: 3-isopropylmalate dehydratase [Saprospiraceae bacterium]|nr:3-isopropylmalate dehydratase [Saprospiraceae bacterium]
MKISGKAHVYGDNIDTDRIIPGKYTKTLDLSTLVTHVMEDLDPGFHRTFKKGDVLVAGDNFGCGSSREQAPLALKEAGVSLIIARFFARIFYRNAINIGLPVLEIPKHDIKNGETVEADLSTGEVIVYGNTLRKQYALKMPDIMLEILHRGGLEKYLLEKGDYQI